MEEKLMVFSGLAARVRVNSIILKLCKSINSLLMDNIINMWQLLFSSGTKENIYSFSHSVRTIDFINIDR